ncbi:MAG: hypothetical protein KBT03_13580 [Bacteroidales bacterium]|nr:hypothetical protein [Candidatus Scybalousia scybalohippi]
MDSKKAYSAIFCYFEQLTNKRIDDVLSDWSSDCKTRQEAREEVLDNLLSDLENIGLRDFGEFIVNELDGCYMHKDNVFNNLYDEEPRYVMPEIEEMGKLVKQLKI